MRTESATQIASAAVQKELDEKSNEVAEAAKLRIRVTQLNATLHSSQYLAQNQAAELSLVYHQLAELRAELEAQRTDSAQRSATAVRAVRASPP